MHNESICSANSNLLMAQVCRQCSHSRHQAEQSALPALAAHHAQAAWRTIASAQVQRPQCSTGTRLARVTVSALAPPIRRLTSNSLPTRSSMQMLRRCTLGQTVPHRAPCCEAQLHHIPYAPLMCQGRPGRRASTASWMTHSQLGRMQPAQCRTPKTMRHQKRQRTHRCELWQTLLLRQAGSLRSRI